MAMLNRDMKDRLNHDGTLISLFLCPSVSVYQAVSLSSSFSCFEINYIPSHYRMGE